jgi:predicted dehydrogenase
MKETIGVGLIGYGYIGRVHAYAYQSLPYLYNPMPAAIRLVGVAAQSEGTVRLAAGQTGVSLAVQDYHQVIAREDVDLVDICVPNHLHKEIVLAAVQAGKHIYCEKPLAASLADARQIAEAARRSKGFFQVTFNYRFAPAILRARQLLETGFLGEVIGFSAEYLHSGYLSTARPMSWRLRRSQSGGGALVDLGSHAADLLVYLTGQKIRRVQAKTCTVVPRRQAPGGSWEEVDVDDQAQVLVELESGASGVIQASRVAMGAADSLNIVVRGSQGAFAWHLMEPNWLEIYDGRLADGPLGNQRGWQKIESIQSYPPPAALPSSKSSLGWMRMHIASQFNLVHCIATGRFTGPGVEDGYHVQQFLDASYKSATSSRWEYLGE